MSDLIERLRDKTRLRAAHGLSGWVLSEEALLSEAADEIDRLRDENERLRADLDSYMAAANGYLAEIEPLRAALVAAMEIVQKERVRIAHNAKRAPPAIEIGYADILRRLDAVIVQADAARGKE